MKQFRKWMGISLSMLMLVSVIPIQAQGRSPTNVTGSPAIQSVALKGETNKSTKPANKIAIANSVVSISRIQGLNRYDTAAKISASLMNLSNLVILASGQNYPDALAGGAYAAELNVPMLLTMKDQLPQVTLDELDRLGATQIQILGGTSAISQAVEDALEADPQRTVTRIQGLNRYETAVEIAKKMTGSKLKVFLASGENFADAISIGPVAALSKTPVLLTQSASLSPATMAALEDWGTTEVTILGGTTAISQEVQDTLEDMMPGGVNRIGGATRYETNDLINRAYYTDPTKLYIASGEAYPDALTGSLLAAKDGTTIGLTKAGELPLSLSTYVTGNPITQVVILGGMSAISMAVETSIELLLAAKIPVVELLGSNPASVTVGSKAYADPGVYATDQINGNITDLVTQTNNIDLGTIGSYTVEYSVTNSFGNTTSATRTVNVVGRQNPLEIPKFTSPMLVPWTMPQSPHNDTSIDYYEIAMRQFQQQMLPIGMPKTTVWGYGSATEPNAVFNAPSLTIEATTDRPVRVKWINDLIDGNGNYLPHLLTVDQNLHWANPNGMMPDMTGSSPLSYVGPVPIVTHVHGAHVAQESDGYPEAWYLPDADNIPAGYHRTGTSYDLYKDTALSGNLWTNGNATFDYTNDQKAATLWYHDHALGMTRTNVYTGPAGFYLIRDPGGDKVYTDALRTIPGVLPSGENEIPIAIQDRSFNEDGSLFYPDSREFFDGFTGPYLPDPGSDLAPFWNPEFFGDTIIANGQTWPYQEVEQERYRFRLLNGSQSRTLILKLRGGLPFWQIGSDGGFLTEPVELTQLILGPAERADVIIDFSLIPVGTEIILENVGPDSPLQGMTGIVPADPLTTGLVLQFRVVKEETPDPSTPMDQLVLPVINPLKLVADNTRQVSLNEVESAKIIWDGPRAALLGTVMDDGTGILMGVPQTWMSPVTESVNVGDTEIWEIYNFTMDAHPIHLHLVSFEVINRQDYDMLTGQSGTIYPANSWETGFKDTLLAFPGQITRIKAKFDKAGRYVWHCHILEHEDNEMMRPFDVN